MAAPRTTRSIFSEMCSRPENVGIIAMDIYFPKTAVSQSDLGTLINSDILRLITSRKI